MAKKKPTKSEQLLIRVSPKEKQFIKYIANDKGLSMSELVLQGIQALSLSMFQETLDLHHKKGGGSD